MISQSQGEIHVSQAVWYALAVVCGIILLLLLRGRLGRTLLRGLERVQEVCAVLIHKALHPEQWVQQDTNVTVPVDGFAVEQLEHSEKSNEGAGAEVIEIVTRLLGLFFTLDVLLALLILDGIRTGLVIFENESSAGLIKLPVSIPTIMGLLGWSMIALMGSFLLEIVMKRMPRGFEFLLPWWREARASRILFRMLISVGNVALFLYVMLLGLVAQQQLFHIHWPAASIIVAALQMLLANLVGIFSLWIIVLGLGALFALGCLIVQLVCAVLHLLLRSWVKPGQVVMGFGVNGAAGTGLDVLGKQDKHNQWPIKSTGETGGTEAFEESIPAKTKPVPYQTTLITSGESGLRLLPTMVNILPSLGGRGTLRISGYVPTGHAPDRSIDQGIRQVQARVISITPRELAFAHQKGGDDALVHEWLLNREFFKAQQETPKVAGHELFLVGLDANLVQPAINPLTRLSAALPRQAIVPVVEVPTGQLARPEVLRAVETLEELWNKKVVTTSLLTDRQGLTTQRVVREKQGRLLARSLNGLVVAQEHYSENPTGAQILTQLGEEFPFVGMSVGNIPLPAGEKLSALDPGRWSSKSARGRGDVEQTQHSLEGLALKLLEDPASRLFPGPFYPERRPLYGVVFIPFPRPQKQKPDRRYLDICEGLEQWASQTVPGATLVFISGPGEPVDGAGSHYFSQWAWLYGFTLEELLSQTGLLSAQSKSKRGLKSGTAPQREHVGQSASVATNASGNGQGKQPGKRSRRTPLRAM
jgi:hypothetical protein